MGEEAGSCPSKQMSHIFVTPSTLLQPWRSSNCEVMERKHSLNVVFSEWLPSRYQSVNCRLSQGVPLGNAALVYFTGSWLKE